MKMKYSGVALSVLFVTRKCALSCCGRVGESRVTKGTVSPPKPTGRGGTSAQYSRISICTGVETAIPACAQQHVLCLLARQAGSEWRKSPPTNTCIRPDTYVQVHFPLWRLQHHSRSG